MGFPERGIVAAGHALVDIAGTMPDTVPARFKDMKSPSHVETGDMEELLAALSSEMGSGRIGRRAGGGAVITAEVCSALGMPSEVWASVGGDENGAFLERELLSAGTTPRLVKSPVPTGAFCALRGSGNERTIIVSRGAARGIRGARIPDEALRPGWALYLDGLLVDDLPWLGELAGRAKARGMKVAMDLSTPGNAERRAAELLDFAGEFCDLVFANENEYRFVKPLIDALGREKAETGAAWIVKRGPLGAAYLRGGLVLEAPAAAALRPADDTGAGDAFSAGFLRSWLRGEDAGLCLRAGNAAAAALLSAREPDPRLPFGPAAFLEAFRKLSGEYSR